MAITVALSIVAITLIDKAAAIEAVGGIREGLVYLAAALVLGVGTITSGIALETKKDAQV